MDVWFTHCQRRAKCRWCEKPIEKSKPMVITRLWRKGDENSRKWNITNYYHPECYLAQGLDYLERNPYSPRGNRGRPKLHLSEEDKRKRYLLLRKKAALDQRKRKLKTSYPDSALMVARIDAQIVEICMDIALVGGVPKSWVEQL